MIVPPDAAPAPGVAGGSGALPARTPIRLSPPWPPGPLRTAMRMSVIFKSDGLEFRLTFWGYASRSAKRPSPAAAAPFLRSERRPNAFLLIDIYSPFRHQNLLAFGNGLLYPSLNSEADARPPGGSSQHQCRFAGSITWCSQVAPASASDSLNCAVSGASSGRGMNARSKGRCSREKPWNSWTTSPAGSRRSASKLAPAPHWTDQGYSSREGSSIGAVL